MIPRSLALVLLLSAVIGGALGHAAPAPDQDPAPHAVAAAALREAERLTADAAFWTKAARAWGGEAPMPRIREAWEERTERLREVEQSHRLRTYLGDLCDGLPTLPSPASLHPVIDNEFFPLVPGRTSVFETLTKEGVEILTISVSDETRSVDGVPCRVVEERLEQSGEVVELATLWFAQDATGAVWAFGESDRQFEGGFLESVEGSWRSGHQGAIAGVVMDGKPTVGAFRRKAYAPGIDEDVTRVVATNTSVTLSSGTTYTGCVQIEERDPMAGGSVDMKWFAPGVGLVLEVDLVSGERTELVATSGN